MGFRSLNPYIFDIGCKEIEAFGAVKLYAVRIIPFTRKFAVIAFSVLKMKNKFFFCISFYVFHLVRQMGTAFEGSN